LLIRTGETEAGRRNISFTIQNCNSLNLTGSVNNFDLKIAAIVEARTDIILLSDTRIISSKGVSSSQRICNSLRDCKIRKYVPFFNSSANSRGVAILIGNDLEYDIIHEYRDLQENFYILDIEINKIRYGIGAIYGPNSTSREFYRSLRSILDTLTANGVTNIVLGGDWNTTVDRSPIVSNIDTFYMAGLPNPKNSELLQTLCNDFELIDPFRVLYPNKRDYTYTPFGTARVNRSRIDFFIMSSSLVGLVKECAIKDAVSCKLFDHKQVSLFLGPCSQKGKGKIRLSNSFLDEKLLSFSVEIATRRAHLYSLDWNAGQCEIRDIFEAELIRINAAINIYKELALCMENRAKSGDDEMNVLLIAAKQQDIQSKLDDMMPLQQLELVRKRCNDVEFFVALTSEIRSAGAKTQKFLSRLSTIYDNSVSKRLDVLKMHYEFNSLAIAELENTLKIKNDNRLKEKLKDIKIFECLHAEKATPLLLDLAKKTSVLDSVSNVKGEDGQPFTSEEDRNVFICRYYSDLYKVDESVSGSIEDFLGPIVSNHPTVTGSKLTDFERNELDGPLVINELDDALKKSNLRSAPGIDGYSYRFISKFWKFFRYTLFRCAEYGLEGNCLPDFFKTAVIKLIPKKGDTSKIKNWRPISLLSNFYKIVSRLINTRLQKICNRVLSRAQKGFTKTRQIQEVIINCIETMEYCKNHKIKGVLASIDQTKAFDSVSHSYMLKVYSFFGFGERIVNWLTSIGTGRTACILLGDGSLSSEFNLGKGHAQGDSPSPLLYNLAAQIQIFKLELDPSIDRINRFAPPALQIQDLPQQLNKCEGQGQTNTNESFADDSSNLFIFNLQSLNSLKIILTDFKKLSGLSSNLEKSFIMRIGELTGVVPQEVLDLGFSFTNKIKLLGFTLQNYGDIIATNFEEITTKITNLIRFWERFFLSLPGRITIYKTLLIPQINYVATIFMPDIQTINNLQMILQRFVLNGFSITVERIYNPVKSGGLGLFPLREFIMALQCSWIKRSFLSVNDNWKYQIALLGNGNPLMVVDDSFLLNNVKEILRAIIVSYCTFKCKFTEQDNNYLSVPIYCNNAFGYGWALQNKLDENFFELNGDVAKCNSILGVAWKDISRDGLILPRIIVYGIIGFELSNRQHAVLATCLRIAVRKYHKDTDQCKTLRDFMVSFKKG
jgi:exonuclease III